MSSRGHRKSLSTLRRENTRLFTGDKNDRHKHTPLARADTTVFVGRDSPKPVSQRSARKHHPREIDHCIETLKDGELLSEEQIAFVCTKLIEVLLDEPNIRSIPTPVTLVGDVHGQYYDLMELFRIGGDVPYTNYLFLGDYVDRGHYSLETISLLACYKLRYPDRVTLIRGNHESRQTTMAYGFYAECMSKYKGPEAWKSFTDMFDFLPLAALVDNRILAVHGGLSPSLHTLDQIRVLDRFQEVPYKGPICDLMWGDPDPKISGFRVSTRGAGFVFGRDVVDQFLRVNDIDAIVRAHQLCNDGYDSIFDDTFVTVWSAPNYCYRMKNKASILEISCDHSRHFNVFAAAPDKHRVGLRPPQMTKQELWE